MQEFNIEVGDRVTYKKKNGEQIYCETIQHLGILAVFKNQVYENEILKIERPKYEVIEEKKELLTEEEREFLKQYVKFNGKEIEFIEKFGKYIKFYIKRMFNDYLETSEFYYFRSFENLEENKKYTLSELGLYEGE